MKSYLSARHVSKRFKRKRVLDDVSFELDAPGVTVLLGPNGAGKSTLLSCVLGLLKHLGGFFGNDRVFGKGFGKPSADQGLASEVGDGNRALVLLA